MSLPHSFDSVPLSITKGPVDDNVGYTTAQVVTTTTWKCIHVQQTAVELHFYGTSLINPDSLSDHGPHTDLFLFLALPLLSTYLTIP